MPKLRYYHHIKKVDPAEEEENNNVSIKTQPITASAKKNGTAGQMKITGKAWIILMIELFTKDFFLIPDFLKEKKRPTVTTRKKQR